MAAWGNPLLQRDSLVNLCSGKEATEEIKNDLLNAESTGEEAFQEFMRDRIQSTNVPFYDPIKRVGLKSFKDLTVKKTVSTKSKQVVIAAERSIFGRLLIAKDREGLSLKEVLSYSLSPIPWCFGQPDGSLVKTVKSKLLSKCFIYMYLCTLAV